MVDQPAFEFAVLGRGSREVTPQRRASSRTPGGWPLELSELDEHPPERRDEPPCAADASAPQQPPSLLFDEADLARACAAAAAAASAAAERAAMARAAEADATTRTQLAAAIAALRAELVRRDQELRARTADLVRAALAALLPRLREERLAGSIERMLRTALDTVQPASSLVLELPEDGPPGLAARAPALLAEAGFEGTCEVRTDGPSGDVIRLRSGEFWAELDASAWAAEVCDRIGAWLAAPTGEPVDVERP